MNQGQGNIFAFRKQARSIFRIEKPQIVGNPVKIRIFFIFASVHYPESGSRKHFHASGVCTIDYPHQIIHIWVIFRKKFRVQNSLKKSQKSTCLGHPVKSVSRRDSKSVAQWIASQILSLKTQVQSHSEPNFFLLMKIFAQG